MNLWFLYLRKNLAFDISDISDQTISEFLPSTHLLSSSTLFDMYVSRMQEKRLNITIVIYRNFLAIMDELVLAE